MLLAKRDIESDKHAHPESNVKFLSLTLLHESKEMERTRIRETALTINIANND